MADGERDDGHTQARAGESATEALVHRRLFDKVRATLGRIPFTADALAAYYAATDPATPAHVKAVLMGALAYFIVPADMIPDVIAGLGFTDDATVLYAALRVLARHVRPAHYARARAFLGAEAGDEAD